MKKILSIALVLALMFSSLALFSCKEDKPKYEFQVESDPTKIIAGLVSGTIDIAALPTNAASNVYNKTNGQVQILAINTLGVLYVVENGNTITNLSDLEGKTIYCPAQNPTFILKYILKANNINATIDSTTYAAPDALSNAVKAEIVPLAVLPEPMVTKVVTPSQVKIDLTEEWNKISDGKELVQGCIVARKDFIEKYPATVNAFLDEYKKSIEFTNDSPEIAGEYIKEFNIFGNATVATTAIPKCNIAYMEGDAMKASMSSFLEAMYSIAPASIGNAIPNDDFYYSRSNGNEKTEEKVKITVLNGTTGFGMAKLMKDAALEESANSSTK